jgi:hypothetical protein
MSSWWKVASLALVAGTAGCAPKLTMEDLKQMRPARPAALDQLDQFVGVWSSEGTANIIGMDEPVKISGTSKAEWQGDKWYMVEDGEFRMGDMEPGKTKAIWAYDENRNRFRIFMVENMGTIGNGVIHYSERKNIWKMKSRGTGPMGNTKGVGTIKFLDANTMDFTWKEYARWDVFRLFEFAEFRGTAKRQS